MEPVWVVGDLKVFKRCTKSKGQMGVLRRWGASERIRDECKGNLLHWQVVIWRGLEKKSKFRKGKQILSKIHICNKSIKFPFWLYFHQLKIYLYFLVF